MRLAPPLFAVAILLALPLPTLARPTNGDAVQTVLAEDLASGRIDREAWLLQSFRYVFAPDRLDARYVPESRTLLRCFTPVIVEFEQSRAELSSSSVAEIDRYLQPATTGLRALYISPGGNFSLTYSTTGSGAVPTADVNPANGIPDFVERCAEYMDYSWTQEIDTLGFTAPALPTDGTYNVYFASMGAYGFTSPSGPGQTEITLHNTFLGFPPNTDPDGNQLGAAKVTCAHEFKHASQYNTSSWSEGGWVELDATWMEDIVYSDTNDYWNYTNNNGGSVLGQPWTALDSGGTGSYEDCLWQHYMSTRFGVGIMLDFWGIRHASPAQAVKTTYQNALGLYGSDWDDSYPAFLEYAWFTGSRSEPGFGFPDAPNLKRMNLRVASAVSTYPFHTADSVDQLAGHPFRFNPGTGVPRVQFDGLDGHTNFAVSVITLDTSDVFTITRPSLDANNVCDYLVPLPWSSLQYVGVIVTNSKRSGGVVSYTLDVLDDPGAVGAPLAAAASQRLIQEAPSPNPTASATRVRFALPREGRVSVRILDVMGRVVRTIVDEQLGAGPHDAMWDGRDAAGSPAASGVYWSRVETRDSSVTRKVTLLR